MSDSEKIPGNHIIGNTHEVFRSWVNSFTDILYARAYSIVSDEATAEDLVQETFLSAFQAFDRFKGASSPKTWLFSILNHKITDHFRRQAQSPIQATGGSMYFDEWEQWKTTERPGEWTEEEGNPLDNHEFKGILDKCLRLLPAGWRMAVQLKYFDHKEGREICQELQISQSNFWQLIHRAKLQLRKCLELHWFKK